MANAAGAPPGRRRSCVQAYATVPCVVHGRRRRFGGFPLPEHALRSANVREEAPPRYALPFESAVVPHEAPPASLPVRAVRAVGAVRGFGRWLRVAIPVLVLLYTVPLVVIAWTSASISTGVVPLYRFGNTTD